MASVWKGWNKKSCVVHKRTNSRKSSSSKKVPYIVCWVIYMMCLIIGFILANRIGQRDQHGYRSGRTSPGVLRCSFEGTVKPASGSTVSGTHPVDQRHLCYEGKKQLSSIRSPREIFEKLVTRREGEKYEARHLTKKSTLVLNLKDRNASKEVWTARMPRFFRQKKHFDGMVLEKTQPSFLHFCAANCGTRWYHSTRMWEKADLWVGVVSPKSRGGFDDDILSRLCATVVWMGRRGRKASAVAVCRRILSQKQDLDLVGGFSLQWLKRLLAAKKLAAGPPIEL